MSRGLERVPGTVISCLFFLIKFVVSMFIKFLSFVFVFVPFFFPKSKNRKVISHILFRCFCPVILIRNPFSSCVRAFGFSFFRLKKMMLMRKRCDCLFFFFCPSKRMMLV
ncbi:hypothetical protein PanWU01x14_350180 [Parasponia andersonii]|uniref:Transmembrane protein n=1 Tax=Parasponia andersonii TaxID=3476 RepID=A0A2P5AB24_PARAD|nr:hypothetical protein PanWU01x14_350180 [Parasponia andersonii]